MKHSFVTPIFKKLARRLGITLVIEPHFEYAGQIILKDGTKRYFRGTNFDLNTLGAAEIARDKDWTTFFLKEMGYCTIKGEAFFSPRWCKAIGSDRGIERAYEYAKKINFPVFIKPNNLSQGDGVVKVYTRIEFMQAVKYICKKDRVFLVQPVMEGRDYRIVVLDGEIMSAYERLPLSVTGDGHSTIIQLLEKKQKNFNHIGRDTIIQYEDFRITNCLRRQGYTRDSIVPKATTVALLDNSNLSNGGDARDLNGSLHLTFQKLCIDITRDMGLRYCGVDLMVQGDITAPLNNYCVIEINAAPGIDNYASSGDKQKKIVENMYHKVLQAMANK